MASDAIIFRGIDGAECEEFIYQMHKLGRDNDKIFDGKWLARMAMSHMTAGALRWFDTLAPEVQWDWEQLRPALLRQWSEPETRAAPPIGIAPSRPIVPAMTLIHQLSENATFSVTGARIRLVTSSGECKGYISKDIASGNYKGALTVTSDIDAALQSTIRHTNNPNDWHFIAMKQGPNTPEVFITTLLTPRAAGDDGRGITFRGGILVATGYGVPPVCQVVNQTLGMDWRAAWKLDLNGRLTSGIGGLEEFKQTAHYVIATTPTGQEVVCAYSHSSSNPTFENNYVYLMVDPVIL